MSDDYRVQLDIYNGPLDLLLYLIRRDELDVYDIPIARVTEQYCQYVSLLEQIDPEAVGEFLVMASTLMEIKSRMLLPRTEAAADEEEIADPRLELVRQLLEYKRFKDAAGRLADHADERAGRAGRPPLGPLRPDPGQVDLEEVQVWDLLAAFSRMMTQTGRTAAHEVTYDDTPIALHAADIIDQLQQTSPLMFAAIFAGRTKSECIGLFLALLELIRQRRIRAEQPERFGPIEIVLLDASPIRAEEFTADESTVPVGPAADAEAPEPAGGTPEPIDVQEPADDPQPAPRPDEPDPPAGG